MDDATPDDTAVFTAERERLLRIARRIVRDPGDAEDVVQQAWLRLSGSGGARPADGRGEIANLPAWLTTVTTRLCLDLLRRRTAEPRADIDTAATAPDPGEQLALADTVGIALHIVLDRLTPTERVAFVLHDSFGIEFAAIAEILQCSPAAARKLASRARGKVAQPGGGAQSTDWQVVDAFLQAARGGDLRRLLEVLAPDVVVAGDADAVATGTPERIAGSAAVAAMFNGAAKAALAVWIGTRPGAAWFHRGQARVAFDFTVLDGAVTRIDLRADAAVLAGLQRRRGDERI